MHPFRLPPALRRLLPAECLWQMPATERTLYLTFDDGPIPEETPFVLEQLTIFQAQATFFCVGDNLTKHPDLARQALAAGHRLANHTFHHLSAWSHAARTWLHDVQLCQEALDALQPEPEPRPLLRPPYGRITPALVRAVAPRYQVVMWDVLTCDYDATLAPEKSLRVSIRHSQPGTIVVFHDSRKASRNLRYVLPRYLEHFAEQGFAFAKL